MVCLHGRCTVRLDDGRNIDTVLLDSAARGLYVPPRIWNDLLDFSPDAIVLCFASEFYDPAEYIHDRGELRPGSGEP
jgi:dTDP-4-dehydrorhamnose 3,5-epimerase-like enzyme